MKGVAEGTTTNHETLQYNFLNHLSHTVSWFNYREAIALVRKVEEVKDGVRNKYAGCECITCLSTGKRVNACGVCEAL